MCDFNIIINIVWVFNAYILDIFVFIAVFSIASARLTDADRDDVSVASNLDLMDGSVVGDSDTHAEEHCPVGLPTQKLPNVEGKRHWERVMSFSLLMAFPSLWRFGEFFPL